MKRTTGYTMDYTNEIAKLNKILLRTDLTDIQRDYAKLCLKRSKDARDMIANGATASRAYQRLLGTDGYVYTKDAT